MVALFGRTRFRSRTAGAALWLGAACVCFGPRAARAVPETAAPGASAASSRIKPAAERQLGERKRPTIEREAEREARSDRATRVSLQIPERLRAALHRKIDARIGRNIADSKRLRAEALGLLQKFIAESPEDAPDMAEVLVRIAELEWEQARDRFLVAFQRWEKTPADARGEPPSPDYSKARARLLIVLKRHKRFRSYDLALYVDGFLANEEGKFDESLRRFNKILEWFPNSRFVPDAHMVRAEYEFTKEFPDYAAAYREYEKVLEYKDSELYDIAMFKSAWTLWRLGRTEEAARRFLIVFKQTADEAESKGARRAEIDGLQREALKNLVAVFVEDEKNRAEDMYRFLVKAGGDRFAGKIVRALADAFYEQAQYERGIEAYRLLLKLEPVSPEAYSWALKVAQGHSTMEVWVELEKDYRWLVREYLPPPAAASRKPAVKPSVWVSAQAGDAPAKAERAAEKQLREDAVGLHAKAQADKTSRVEYEWAAKLYAVYVARFGDSDAAYELSFNQAEIYFYHLDDAQRAADAYLRAVRKKPRGELSRTALYNALAALEVARAAEFEDNRKKGEKPKETQTDKQLTEAMELYVKTYPDDKQVPELLFRQGKLYYDYQVYDPAVRQWGLLLEKYPTSQYASDAGELVLDSFNKSEDYENIEVWARRLKSAPSFQSPAQQAKLNGLIVAAVFKLGEQHGKAGRHDKAAAAYLRAAREFPGEERAAQAAVNAEVEARRAADLVTLTAAAGLLVKDHKHRSEAAQGVWIAANTYQSIGLFKEAAEYHDIIVDTWPKFEHHKDAAFNAVLLRTTSGDRDGAISSGNKFKRYYGRDALADEVTFLMGKAHEKAEKWSDAERLYNQYSRSAKNPNSQVEALVRLAIVRKKDERGAAAALNRAMQVYKARKPQLDAKGKYYAARARYMQGERILGQYETVKIEGDVGALKKRLKQKSELLRKAADAFLATAEMGVAEWTTAALYQIGFAYESFAQALLNSPPPDSLSDQEKELFSQALDEFVIPIEERSIEAYESGWLKALELGIFNEWTAKMREALGRLNSELYPPLHEIGFALRSKGPLPLPPLISGPRRTKAGHSENFLLNSKAATKKETDASEVADAASQEAPR